MRRYVIGGIFILSALLPTPQVFTYLWIAISLQLLFEMTVWTTWYRERNAKQRAASETATGGGQNTTGS